MVKQTGEQEKSGISRWLLRAGWLLLFMGLVTFGWEKLADPALFPIRQVEIQGAYPHLDRNVVRAAITPFLTASFWNIDVEGLQGQLLASPWLKSASVSRVWPDKLVIGLSEQTAVARWGDNSLVNPDGQIFSPPAATFPEGLPQLNGPLDQQQVVMDMYKQMTAQVAPLGLKINSLELSPRFSWQLILSNGMQVMLGRTDTMARLARLISVYNKIFANHNVKGVSVDLRYTNGLAVQWQPSLGMTKSTSISQGA